VFPIKSDSPVDKERINCEVLRPIWPLTSANWKRIPELPLFVFRYDVAGK